ncbi:hypothetical protein, partial [Marinilabilia sp.]|uniref:hypothetical protein n=1 Tax=Marinilabilia sp. TaxID=2021252 RepID=UPI0025C581AE
GPIAHTTICIVPMALQNHQSSIGATHLKILELIPGDKKNGRQKKNTLARPNRTHNNMHRAYGTTKSLKRHKSAPSYNPGIHSKIIKAP